MAVARRKRVLKIIHPIWNYCGSLIDDPFWKEIYTQGSYGKMPKHFVYSNGFLGYSKGVKKYRTIIISQNEPMVALEESLAFFRENGLMSEGDTLMFKQQEDDDIPDGIMSIDAIQKNKKKKKIFIEYVLIDFAHRYCTYNKIPESTNTLFNILFDAYKNKCLNDVVVENRDIVGIVGLSHEHNGSIIYQSSTLPKISKTKYVPVVEIIDPNFTIRNKSRVNIGKCWLSWLNNINNELGRKEILHQFMDQATVVSETE